MPKVDIDYSNTIFYKIYCKDTSIDDLYIGHTTNFVQRKHGHKQGCKNSKSSNYNCKLYNTIRDNKGWDNWIMEIIAFHNCDDLYAAKKLEQSYFEDYNATLNSIEPLPKPKPKLMKYTPPHERPHCNVCDVYFGSNNLWEIHNTTKKHRTNVIKWESLTTNEFSPINPGKYICEKCDFKSTKKSNYDTHLTTAKHINRTNRTVKMPENAEKFVCDCGKIYKARNSLWYHKQKCRHTNVQVNNTSESIVPPEIDTNLVVELLKQNQEFKEMIIDQNKKMTKQQDTIIELTKVRI